MRKTVFVLTVLLLMTFAGCAAVEVAHQQRIDNAISLTAGVTLGEYRQIVVDRLQCEGESCSPAKVDDLTRLLSKTMTDACYSVIDFARYRAHVSHFGRRMEKRGRSVVYLDPTGAIVHFSQLPSGLRNLIADELAVQGVVSGTFRVGPPDEVTQFRPITYDVSLIGLNRQTVWHVRLEDNILGEESAEEDLRRGMRDVAAAVIKKASLCSLPPEIEPEYNRIEVVADEIRLHQRVYFELDSNKLSPRSYALLNRLAAFLQTHPELRRIRIEGHTDDYGEPAYNLKLSKERASTVRRYLIQQGVNVRRLDAIGYGEERPLVPNTTEANRAKNRRVEFKVVRAPRQRR